MPYCRRTRFAILGNLVSSAPQTASRSKFWKAFFASLLTAMVDSEARSVLRLGGTEVRLHFLLRQRIALCAGAREGNSFRVWIYVSEWNINTPDESKDGARYYCRASLRGALTQGNAVARDEEFANWGVRRGVDER